MWNGKFGRGTRRERGEVGVVVLVEFGLADVQGEGVNFVVRDSLGQSASVGPAARKFHVRRPGGDNIST